MAFQTQHEPIAHSIESLPLHLQPETIDMPIGGVVRPSQDDSDRHQVTKSNREVLAPRWSDSRASVLLVDIITGHVKAEWHQNPIS